MWRNTPEDPWKVYAYDQVQFGDDIAALCLELARKKAAEAGLSIDPMAARQLVRNGYIDDIAGGGSLEEALRMKGQWLGEKYSGTMTRILDKAGFKAKHMVIGGRCTQQEAESLGGKFLGIGYDPLSDEIKMEVNPSMQMSKGKRGRDKWKQVVQIDESLMADIMEKKCNLTRRIVLAFIMSQFDPLGIMAPIWIQGKLLLQKLIVKESNRGWDEPLHEDEVSQWTKFIEFTLTLQPISVPRTVPHSLE